MAGEYSRELSAKVFIGQCRLIELGFRQGGSPGFGLRRMLRDVTGQHKGVLNRGEQKNIQTDRVILVPGPPEEMEIVRWMYRMFVEERIETRQDIERPRHYHRFGAGPDSRHDSRDLDEREVRWQQHPQQNVLQA